MIDDVSTHSRPKAAAPQPYILSWSGEVSTHSRPKAAAKFKVNYRDVYIVSTHSRPKAAAKAIHINITQTVFQHTAARRRLHIKTAIWLERCWFQHTAARRRLQHEREFSISFRMFQHTAARRRLLLLVLFPFFHLKVSTHSRPKAAAFSLSKIDLS